MKTKEPVYIKEFSAEGDPFRELAFRAMTNDMSTAEYLEYLLDMEDIVEEVGGEFGENPKAAIPLMKEMSALFDKYDNQISLPKPAKAKEKKTVKPRTKKNDVA